MKRPNNATRIAKPPGIQELVTNSPPKPVLAHLTGFSIQKPSRLCHLAAFCRHGTLLCSLGAIQQTRTLWRDNTTTKPPGVPGSHHRGCPHYPLHGGSHQARGHAKPQQGEVPTAPWRGMHLGHAFPGWAAAEKMALHKETDLICRPPAQLRQCSLQSHRPSNATISWSTIPGLKNGRKISLTGSWVWKRAGASHADHANPPCGCSPRVAGNST